eukprot:14398759-Alexandrium_andersonii.AAC.1
MWWSAGNRFVTYREKLSSMGFPTYPHLATAARATMVDGDLPKLSRMVGNAMSLPMIGVVCLCAIASCKEAPDGDVDDPPASLQEEVMNMILCAEQA